MAKPDGEIIHQAGEPRSVEGLKGLVQYCSACGAVLAWPGAASAEYTAESLPALALVVPWKAYDVGTFVARGPGWQAGRLGATETTCRRQ
jgi:hypothetical protein